MLLKRGGSRFATSGDDTSSRSGLAQETGTGDPPPSFTVFADAEFLNS
ncbi:MAG: hypothetical protein ACRDZ5_07855 [Acidimicrobiales bacterium]